MDKKIKEPEATQEVTNQQNMNKIPLGNQKCIWNIEVPILSHYNSSLTVWHEGNAMWSL